MTDEDVVVGLIFLSQTTAGLLGNSFLLYHYLLLYFMRYKLNFTDLLHNYLMIANFLTLLCKGVPQTMTAFGLKGFLSDLECKLLFYLHKMGRGACICSTCFLTVLMAISISPRSSTWAVVKAQASKYLGSCIYLNWILYILMGTNILMYMTGQFSYSNMTILHDFGYCSFCLDRTGQTLHAVFLPFPEVMCVGLSLCASSFMVFILHRHKQKMQQFHMTELSPRPPLESRATKYILLLTSTFVCFYTISCIVRLSLELMNNPSLLLRNMAAIISGCFPTLSPFLIMSQYPSVSSVCFPCSLNRKSSKHGYKM